MDLDYRLSSVTSPTRRSVASQPRTDIFSRLSAKLSSWNGKNGKIGLIDRALHNYFVFLCSQPAHNSERFIIPQVIIVDCSKSLFCFTCEPLFLRSSAFSYIAIITPCLQYVNLLSFLASITVIFSSSLSAPNFLNCHCVVPLQPLYFYCKTIRPSSDLLVTVIWGISSSFTFQQAVVRLSNVKDIFLYILC